MCVQVSAVVLLIILSNLMAIFKARNHVYLSTVGHPELACSRQGGPGDPQTHPTLSLVAPRRPGGP